MFNTFVIICVIFAVLMAVNLVVKAADIRKTVEEVESDLRSLNHNINQLHNDSNFNVAKVLASSEGIKVAVEGVKESSEGVKAAVDDLNRSSCENVNRYIDFIRSLTPPEEQPDGGQPSSDPAPEQETLLVEEDALPELKEGEAIASIVDEHPNPAAE